MDNYPVVFKCSECTIEHATVEQLFLHIWNRHLRTFPFRCATCSYPALTMAALTTHFHSVHPNECIVFKRNASDEIKVLEILSQSIVVQIYDEEEVQQEQVMYQEHPSQGLDAHVHDDLESMQPSTSAASSSQQGRASTMRAISGLKSSSVWEAPPSLKRVGEDMIYMEEVEDTGEEQEGSDLRATMHGISRNVEQDETVPSTSAVEEDEMMMHEDIMMDHHQVLDSGGGIETEVVHGEDDEGTQYIYDDDGNLHYATAEGEDVDDANGDVMYIDEQGNRVYLESPFGTTSKGRLMHSRMIKQQHIEMIVRKVAESRTPRRKDPIMHQCEICGKILKYPSKIAEHRRSHTGEKPHQCPTCQREFTQRSALKVHMRQHTGEKPYACTWDCGKSFPSSSALKLHEKTHSGVRNYHCNTCGQLFTKRSHVERHKKSKHKADGTEADATDIVLNLQEKAVVNEVIEAVREERLNKMYSRQLAR